MPGMRLPPIIVRIIFLAPSKSLSSELTSAVVTPDPLAIRRRRDPEMIPGSRRSAGVMAKIMASARFSSPSSIASAISFSWFLPPGTPGSIFMQVAHGAQLLHLPELVQEVLERELCPSSWLSAAFCASSASIVSFALSISVRTSPMPRMRPAMRSG